jgi:hypothetical protein
MPVVAVGTVTFATIGTVVATVGAAVVDTVVGRIVVSIGVGCTAVASFVGTGMVVEVTFADVGMNCVQPQIDTSATIRTIHPNKIFIQIYM